MTALMCSTQHHITKIPSSNPTSSPSCQSSKSQLCSRKSKAIGSKADSSILQKWDISPSSTSPEWDISHSPRTIGPSHPTCPERNISPNNGPPSHTTSPKKKRSEYWSKHLDDLNANSRFGKLKKSSEKDGEQKRAISPTMDNGPTSPEWDTSPTMDKDPPSHNPPPNVMDICKSSLSRSPPETHMPPRAQNKLTLSPSGRTDVGLLLPMTCTQSGAQYSPRPIETSYIPREDHVPNSPSTTLTMETLSMGSPSKRGRRPSRWVSPSRSSGNTSMSISSNHTSMSMSSDYAGVSCDHELWGYEDDEETDDELFHTVDVMSKYLNMLTPRFPELFVHHREKVINHVR